MRKRGFGFEVMNLHSYSDRLTLGKWIGNRINVERRSEVLSFSTALVELFFSLRSRNDFPDRPLFPSCVPKRRRFEPFIIAFFF